MAFLLVDHNTGNAETYPGVQDVRDMLDSRDTFNAARNWRRQYSIYEVTRNGATGAMVERCIDGKVLAANDAAPAAADPAVSTLSDKHDALADRVTAIENKLSQAAS